MSNLKLTLFSLLTSLALQAQQPAIVTEYAYKKYDIESGLPTSKVICLGKDARGYIWIGTYAGLVRYNGFEFEPIKSIDFSVLRVEETGENEFRAYTSDGFSTVDRRNLVLEKNIFTKEKLYLDFMQSRLLPTGYGLYEDESGSVKKLCFAKDSNLTVITQSPYLDRINSATQLPFYDKKKKRVYIPLENEYVVIADDGKLLFAEKGIQLYSFVEWKKQMYAVGTDGIYKEDAGGKFKLIYPYRFDDHFNGAYAIDDKKGNLIIKDAGSLYRFDNQSVEVICKGLNIIREILFDREGNLWVGANSGLYNFFNLDFRRLYFDDENRGFTSVVSVEKDSTTWLANYQSEIFSFHNNQLRKYSGRQIGHSANENTLSFSTHPASNPNFAILPVNAVDFLKIQGTGISRIKSTIANERVNLSSAILPDGNIVLLTNNQVCVVNPAGKMLQQFSNQGIDTRFIDVVTDAEGRIWVAGQKHISLIENKEIKNLPYKNDFNTISTILRDADNRVWFLCLNTLYCIENQSIEEVKTVPSKCNVFTITKKGLFVFPTNEGIYLYNPKNNTEFKYDKFNGFTGVEPEYKRISEDAYGNVWVSSLKGLFVFNPEKMARPQPKPLLEIQSARFSKNNVDWESKPLQALEVKNKYNNIIFKYLGLCYSAVGNVRYQYRLKGFQNEWSQPVAEREVTFNNLPPGRYTFELKCNAGTHETQTDVVSLPIYIKPAFWQTWFFRMLMFALLAGIIAWLAIRYQREKHEKELRRANREKEMNELRVQSVRLKSIPHFNSNVLAGIEYFIMTKSKEEANELLTTYSRFTNVTLHDIDKAHRPLKDELDYVRMYLELEKMRYGDKLNFTLEVDPSVNAKIRIPNMILHTYAENAVKHGIRGKNSAGTVTVCVKAEKDGVRLSVEDDGVGRHASAQKNAEQNRSGHGLHILNRQIELYNQQNEHKITQQIFDLTDKNGNATGTRFEMYVPGEYEFI